MFLLFNIIPVSDWPIALSLLPVAKQKQEHNNNNNNKSFHQEGFASSCQGKCYKRNVSDKMYTKEINLLQTESDADICCHKNKTYELFSQNDYANTDGMVMFGRAWSVSNTHLSLPLCGKAKSSIYQKEITETSSRKKMWMGSDLPKKLVKMSLQWLLICELAI